MNKKVKIEVFREFNHYRLGLVDLVVQGVVDATTLTFQSADPWINPWEVEWQSATVDGGTYDGRDVPLESIPENELVKLEEDAYMAAEDKLKENAE